MHDDDLFVRQQQCSRIYSLLQNSHTHMAHMAHMSRVREDHISRVFQRMQMNIEAIPHWINGNNIVISFLLCAPTYGSVWTWFQSTMLAWRSFAAWTEYLSQTWSYELRTYLLWIIYKWCINYRLNVLFIVHLTAIFSYFSIFLSASVAFLQTMVEQLQSLVM